MNRPQRPKRDRFSPGSFYEQRVLPHLTAELVYRGVNFRSRSGRYWRAPCPLHNGKESNFVVDTRTGGFTCWSHCGRGSALDFMNWQDGRPTLAGREYVEAVKRAAVLANVDTTELEREATPQEEARLRRGSLLEAFEAHARQALEGDRGRAARVYLERRGFANTEEFGLYTKPAEVRAELEKDGFSVSEIEASGLLQDTRWTGRLVIPWRTRWGRLEAFVARDITDQADAGAKYLRLFGAPISDLFGLDVALRSRERQERLVVVEGLLDALALHREDFLNVAALGQTGTFLSSERWEALAAAGVPEVVLVLDNDEPGREGLLKACSNTSNARNTPNVYVVPPDELGPHKDPDEFLRKRGADAFRTVLGTARRASLYRGLEALRNVNEESADQDKDSALTRVIEIVNACRGPRAEIEREDLFKLAVKKTGYTFEAVASLAQSLEVLSRQDDAKRQAEGGIRTAQVAIAAGNLTQARKALAEAGASLEIEVDEPPAFSVERLERESLELPSGRPSGWPAVDELGVRFNPGELALVGARTGHCKTSFLVGLLKNWLAKSKGEEFIVFYSLEEPEVRVYHRLLALLSRDDTHDEGWTANQVRDFKQDPGSRSWPTYDLLTKAQEQLRRWEGRFQIVPRPMWNVGQLAAHAHEAAKGRPVGAVLVDYLQRLPAPAGSFDRRDIEVSSVARRLKALAVDLNLPVVAGAQINRQAVADAGKIPGDKPYSDAKVQAQLRARRPQLHHLREGGSEQEADLILGLQNYRADFEADATGERSGTLACDERIPDVTQLDVGVLKSRYGASNVWVELGFYGAYHLVLEKTAEPAVAWT